MPYFSFSFISFSPSLLGLLSLFWTRLFCSSLSSSLPGPAVFWKRTLREREWWREECVTVQFTTAIAMPVRTKGQKMGMRGGEKVQDFCSDSSKAQLLLVWVCFFRQVYIDVLIEIFTLTRLKFLYIQNPKILMEVQRSLDYC